MSAPRTHSSQRARSPRCGRSPTGRTRSCAIGCATPIGRRPTSDPTSRCTRPVSPPIWPGTGRRRRGELLGLPDAQVRKHPWSATYSTAEIWSCCRPTRTTSCSRLDARRLLAAVARAIDAVVVRSCSASLRAFVWRVARELPGVRSVDQKPRNGRRDKIHSAHGSGSEQSAWATSSREAPVHGTVSRPI